MMYGFNEFERQVIEHAAGIALNDEKICEEINRYFDLADGDLKRIKNKFCKYLVEMA